MVNFTKENLDMKTWARFFQRDLVFSSVIDLNFRGGIRRGDAAWKMLWTMWTRLDLLSGTADGWC